MRKLILFLLCVFLILSLTACGTDNNPNIGGQSNPASTTGLFIAYIEKGEYENVKSLFNEDALSMYGNEIRLQEFHDVFSNKEGVVINNVDKVNIYDNIATVPVYWTDYNKTINYEINLVKESSGWLIQSISEY